MERMTPTIGRIVLAHVTIGSKDFVLPAIITKVCREDDDGWVVCAKVFCDSLEHGISMCDLHDVPMNEPGEYDPETAEYHQYCEWMPYQKGQAAMTEAIAKKAGINA